jgi:hypothetical protein
MKIDDVNILVQHSNMRLEHKINLMTALIRIDIRLRALRETPKPWRYNAR